MVENIEIVNEVAATGTTRMQRQKYPTDLTDTQWDIVREAMPPTMNGRTDKSRTYPLPKMWNAIFYQARNGCTWRVLPHDLPPWPAVWQQYCRWRDNGTIGAVHEALRASVRMKAGREKTPSAAILDRQSVRLAEKGGLLGCRRGQEDRRTKAPPRPIHARADLGRGRACGNVHDSVGARPVLEHLGWDEFPCLETVIADDAYQGTLEDFAADELGLWLRIVPKLEGQSTSLVLPKRWIVERTFAWLQRYRRLRSEYETNTESNVAWIYTAMIHLMAGRPSHEDFVHSFLVSNDEHAGKQSFNSRKIIHSFTTVPCHD